MKKQIVIGICLFIVFFSMLSVVSASELVDNNTISAANGDLNTISITNDQKGILGNPDGTFEDLERKINSSITDTVDLNDNYVHDGDARYANGITIDKSITIDGHGATVDASHSASIFNIASGNTVVLQNIHFINANGTYGGAVKLDSSSNLKVINCTFTDNTADFGGAIYVSDSTSSTSNVNITGSEFVGNNATFGGAIYWSGVKGSITDSNFTSNFASQNGGAIYWEGNDGVITGSRFKFNKVSGFLNSTKTVDYHNPNTGIDEVHYDILGGDGGAIIWKGSNALIEDTTFYRNYAPYRGGAIFFTNSSENCENVTIKSGNFTQNNAGMNGGALDWAKGARNATILVSYFINNTAGRSAGAIYVSGNDLDIEDTEFNYNKVTGQTKYDNRTDVSNYTSIGGNGGAICWMGSYGDVVNVTFLNNTATQRGGAIQFERNKNGTVRDSRFINNTAGTDGGAIDFYNGAENGKIINSNFTNNVAHEEGGAIYWQGHHGTINGSRFENNRATGWTRDASYRKTFKNPDTGVTETRYDIIGGDGGAIMWTGSHAVIQNSTFYKNNAAYSGGAIYLTGNSTGNCTNITFIDCNFTENIANLNGGAVNWAKGSSVANVTGSYFIKNIAKRSAGAIYISGDYLEIKDSEFKYNDATRDVKYDNRSSSGNFTSLGGNAGAICWMGSYGTVDHGIFINNTARDRGGAIQFEKNQNGTVKNSQFENNSAYGDGGAIDWYQGAVNGQLINSTFKTNSINSNGNGRGAGVYLEGYNATIKDSTFYTHKVTCNGGVIYIEGNESSIRNTTFEHISTTKNGGAIYVYGDNSTIDASNFTDVKALLDGGAIYIIGDGTDVLGCEFDNCTAHTGGVIYIKGNNTFIDHATMTNNNCTEDGGALLVNGTNARLYNSKFINNTAGDDGGAIYWEGANGIVYNITCINNKGISIKKSSTQTSSSRGGSMSITGSNMTMSESTFKSSSAWIAKYDSKGKIDGGALFITGSDVNIINTSFDDCNATNNGGAIYIIGDATNVTGCTFNRCTAKDYGGIIYISGERATIDSSVLANSSSIKSGGAIYVKGNDATINGSDFENIRADANGGAIYVDGKYTDIDHSSFYNCTAPGCLAGAIYINNVGTTVSHSNFTKSSAATAGAISIDGENTTIEYCNFDNNTASSKAGAVHVQGKNVLLTYSNFTNNFAGTEGGALDIGGQNASIYYSWFDNNVGVQNAGAINWIGGGGNDSIIGSRFTNNKCSGTTRGGGAIYWAASTGTMTSGGLIKDTVFINNSATGKHGGAINWYHAVDSKFDNCTFINNSAASDGGAIYSGHQTGKGSNLTIANSRFSGNNAGKHGGAIANQMASSLIYNCTFNNNYASHSGGTILMKENSADNSVIDNCRIYNSQVLLAASGWDEGGGAISIGKEDSKITISNCVIINSTAHMEHGGAIAVRSPDSSLINVTIINSTSANDGSGAIYWSGARGTLDNINITNSTSKSINTKDMNGGAISITGGNTKLTNVEIINSSLYSSNGNGRGGSIYWNAANAILENISITNSSTAGSQGGAIYLAGGSSNANNINIVNSSVNATANIDVAGGSIYCYSANSNLNNVSISKSSLEHHFTSGTKTVYGGAIYINGGNVKLTNVDINDSSLIADNGFGYGGAIYRAAISSNGDNLINVSINNSYVFGSYGGAISWHVGNSNIENISIINSSVVSPENKDAFGGAIYTNVLTKLNRITIINSTANGSRNGYGGGIYWTTSNAKTMTDSSFTNCTADYGGAIYSENGALTVQDTSFVNSTANVDGGAVYVKSGTATFRGASFWNNKANGSGGAVYANNVLCHFYDSSLKNNTAEYGGAIYYAHSANQNSRSTIKDTELINNTAFKGSAIYATYLRANFENVVLLDNQAHSNRFIDKAAGVDGGTNYVSATFVGYDNILNGIWVEGNVLPAYRYYYFTNVTYWGINGRTVTSNKQVADRKDNETKINITVRMYDNHGNLIREKVVETDENGRFRYNFTESTEDGLSFGLYHFEDRYYTYLYETLSNTSIVKIHVDDIFDKENVTVQINLTDGAWAKLSGKVNVTFNDTRHTSVIIDVVDGVGYCDNISGFEVGTYRATAVFTGDLTHSGSEDTCTFRVRPIVDLVITKRLVSGNTKVNVSDELKYEITVKNNGISRSTNVKVTENLSEYLNVTKATPSRGSYNNGVWSIGTLNGGQTVTMTITAKVIHAGTVTNSVHVSGNEDETNYTNNDASAVNVTALPIVDVKITKTVNVGAATVNVTDKLVFTIKVTNDGPCDATNVTVNEVLSPHLAFESSSVTPGYNNYDYDRGIWYIGTLNKGATATLTINTHVKSNGTISNAVNVTSYENDTNLTNNKANITNKTAFNIVNLIIDKEVNTGRYVNVTDKITYTITVHNAGPCDATGVYVNETLSSHLTFISSSVTTGYNNYDKDRGVWYIGKLNKDATVKLTIYAQVKSNGTIENVVSVNSTEKDTDRSDNRKNVTIIALPIVDLTIIKQSNVSGKVNVSDYIQFNITLHNNGPCDATNVNVVEVLSSHLHFEYAKITPIQGNYNNNTGIWHIDRLANQSTAVLTIVAKVTSNGTIANTVTVTSFENDTNKSNNKDSIKNITALPIVDLVINKTVNVTTKTLNLTDRLQFTITVYNAGPCDATGVYVTEKVDQSLKFITASVTPDYGSYDVVNGIWNIGKLNVGKTAVLNITAEVEYPGEIDNNVTVYSNENDTNISNNKANISTITVTTEVDMEITKSASTKGPVNVSDTIYFYITVRNKSPNPAGDVYVDEVLDSHLKLIDYQPTNGTYDGRKWDIGNLDGLGTAKLTIIAEVISDGNISNAVHVSAFGNDTDPSNNNASIDNITAYPVVDLKVTKVADVGEYVNVTDYVKFTITVTNDGPSNATNVNVSEKLSSKLKLKDATVDAGYYNATEGVWHIGNMTNHTSVNMTILAQVRSIGEIENAVIVNSTEMDTNRSNNKDNVTFTSLPIVDLEIIKKANVSGKVNVTDKIEFTITVKNKGPWVASNVRVNEILSSKLKLINKTGYGNYNNGVWFIGDLANQSSVTLTIVAEVTDAGTIDNVVNVSSTETDTNLTNNHDEVSLEAFLIVDVSVTKKIDIDYTDVDVGDVIEFTVTVTNDGPCNATGVYVDEVLDPALTLTGLNVSRGTYENGKWYIGNLNVKAVETLKIVARIDYSGIITNVVVVHSTENDTNMSNNRDNITPLNSTAIADLAITKEVNVSGPINVTDYVEFTVTVHNNGPCNASGVYVKEVLDSHLRLINYTTSDGSKYENGRWDIGYLNFNATVNLTIIAQAISKGQIANFVVVSGNDEDRNLSNNNASTKNITALPIVDLEITKTSNTGDKVNVTDEICYNVTVKNNGPCDATNVTVHEVISSLLNVTSYVVSPGTSYNLTTGIWNIGDLANQSSAVLTIYATVMLNGTIENVVNVSSYENDTNLDNNRANLTIESFPIVDIGITKEVNVTTGEVVVGDIIKFRLNVTNYGPCNATDVYIKEAIDPALRIVNLTMSKGVYIGNYTWVIGKMLPGDMETMEIVARVAYSGYIVNDVNATSKYEKDIDLSNNYDSIGTITSTAEVDLAITKTANTKGPVNVTDCIEFTVSVHNNGPCNASGVYVGEILEENLQMLSYNLTHGTYDNYTWVIGYLDYNETATLTIVANVTAAGNISNVVTVYGFDEDTNTSNNEASVENITALPVVDLEITKTVDVEGGYVNVNDIFQYTIRVTNNGPCDATNVTVSEVISPYLDVITYLTWMGYYDEDNGIWYIGDLPNQYYVEMIIQVQTKSNGTVSNVVTVSSYENDTNTSNNRAEAKDIVALPIVDLEIHKTMNVTDGYLNITDYVEFTVTVYNNGPSNATKVSVSEMLAPNFRLVECNTTHGGYNETTGVWYIGDLDYGCEAVLNITAQVIADGMVKNVVIAYSYENDTNPYNNVAEIELYSIPLVDLSITKTANVTDKVNVTDIIEFSLIAHNNGPSNATGVYVEEILNQHLELYSYNASVGEYDGFTWNIGELKCGSNATLTILARVISEGLIDNNVSITSYEFDTDTNNSHANISGINASAYADLSITKSTNATSVVNVLDVIEFTVVVTNNGPCNATNVLVNEGLDYHLALVGYNATVGTYDGYTWVIGNLNNGTDATLTIIAKVISAGNISNAVMVTCSENDTNTSNSHASIDNITAIANVDLSITKTTNVTTLVNVSDCIEFTISVYNAGPCNATNVLVDERLNYHLTLVGYNATVGTYDGYTWVIGNLNNGTDATLTIIARVISQGNITNAVTVICSENDTNTSNSHASIDNITAILSADLQITKVANYTTVTGLYENIEFTIKVRNNGPCDASGVYVNEHLDAKLLTLLSYYATAGDYDGFTWTIGDLKNGAEATLTIIAHIISYGNITNEVIVNSFEFDTNKSNNHADIPNITVLPSVDLKVTKVANTTGPLNVTDYIEFTVTVFNNGPCNATGVNVSEVLDSNLRLVDYDATIGSYDGEVWNIGNLNNQSMATLTIIAQVIKAGNITNSVNATSDGYERNKSGNTASIGNITAVPIVDLKITKVANTTGPLNVTDYIEFTVTVYNNGPCNATGVNVSELLDSNLRLVDYDASVGSYDGEVWTIGNLNNQSTAILKIVAQVIADGAISNAVNVTGNEIDTNKSGNTASIDNITALPIVDVKVIKFVNETEAMLYDFISYIITVQNDGPSDATHVNVTENLSDSVVLLQYVATQGYYDSGENVWHVGRLSNGSSQTLVLTVQIVGLGVIENSVVAVSKENDTNLTNNRYVSQSVVVEDHDTPIDLYAYDITYGEDEILVVTLPEKATGTVNITVDNRIYNNVPIRNGVVELPVSDLAGGSYNVHVAYGGDERYLPNSTSGSFNVARITPIITIEVEDIWVWEAEVVNVTVNAPGSVFVTVNGITVEIPLENGVVTTDLLTATAKPDYHGNATWNIYGLPAGTYPAFALYPGNENYTSVNVSDVFHVRDVMPTTVTVSADDIYVGEDAVINIAVGPEGVTGYVIVNVDGKNYTVAIKDGKARLTVHGLYAGVVNVTVCYEGNIYYLPSENATTFNVLKVVPPIDVDAFDINVGDDGVITITLPVDATGYVTIEIEGERFTAKVKDGKAVFIIPGLKAGEHDIKVYYSGDDKYLPVNSTGKINVTSKTAPKNETEPVKVAVHNEMYATGNPIAILLVAIFSACFIHARKFRR